MFMLPQSTCNSHSLRIWQAFGENLRLYLKPSGLPCFPKLPSIITSFPLVSQDFVVCEHLTFHTVVLVYPFLVDDLVYVVWGLHTFLDTR